jgi:hypothetical protein
MATTDAIWQSLVGFNFAAAQLPPFLIDLRTVVPAITYAIANVALADWSTMTLAILGLVHANGLMKKSQSETN